MRRTGIEISRDRLADFCQRNHILKLALFGSVLREDFGPESDVDVLVEFDPEYLPGFLRLHDIETQLSSIFGGRRIDLVTEKFLNRRIRERILSDAEVQYAER